ncbi:hypothetical protein SprV_0902707300 [Sparganum proliferum]
MKLGEPYDRMTFGGLLVHLPALLSKSQQTKETNKETSKLQWTNELTITTDREDYNLEYTRNKTHRNEFGDTVWPNETSGSNCSTGCSTEYDGKGTLPYEPDDESDAMDSTGSVLRL